MTPADLSQAAHAIADACAWLDGMRRLVASIPAHHFPMRGGTVADFEGLDTLWRRK